MRRLSSHITLFFALFFPIFWFVFFGALCAAIWIVDPEDVISIQANYTRFGYTIFFILFALLIYKYFFKLRRVEYDAEFIYVTNYFKTVKIPFEQIQSIKSNTVFGLILIKIKLKFKGTFGSQIRCVSKENYFAEFKQFCPISKITE
ncbi:MAG: hypothetical protein WBB26_07340 [Saprospiraceae bacterium]|nr:hypothetical protein [Saprospiraceae bacterium]